MASYHMTIKTDRRPSGTKIKATNHANYICREGKYKNMDNNVKASGHAEYINRESIYEKKGGCVYKAHHLPSWADNSPQKFFAAADEYEAPSRVRYREIEFALPNELSLSQNHEIIEEFINTHLKDFYYAYAIHTKNAVLAEDKQNIHVHIMFSERRLDNIEKTKERTPNIFFKKANHRNPEYGGAKKDECWNGTYRARHLCQVRQDCASIQNKILKKYGHTTQVDPRTLKLQWDEAKAKGDLSLASILDRPPEEHLGAIISTDPNHPKVLAIKKYRAIKLQQQKLFEAAEALQMVMTKDQSEKDISYALHTSDKILKDINKTDHTALESLKIEIVNTAEELSSVRDKLIYYHEARIIARYNLLTPEERAIETRFKDIAADISHLKKMKKELDCFSNDDSIILEKQILDSQIKESQTVSNKLKISMQKINKKFTDPDIKSRLTKATRKILTDNQPTQDKAHDLTRSLDDLTTQAATFIYNNISIKSDDSRKQIYTSQEIKSILDPLIISLQIEYANTKKDIDVLASKVISQNRAYEMAKNVYTKGGYKTYREKIRKLTKETGQIEDIFNERQKLAYQLSCLSKPKWYHLSEAKQEYAMQQQRLADMDRSITLHRFNLKQEEEKLEKELFTLEKYCSTPYAKEKISKIADGILAKNKSYHQEFDEKLQKNKQVEQQLTELRSLKRGVDNQVKIDCAEKNKSKARYCLKNTSPSSSPANSPSSSGLPHVAYLIAKAMKQDSKSATLIARISDDEEIDYDALSTLDKKLLRMKSQ